MKKFTEYMRGVRGELKHVKWPTNRHSWIMTTLVIVFSLIVAGFIGAFDYVFTNILELFV